MQIYAVETNSNSTLTFFQMAFSVSAIFPKFAAIFIIKSVIFIYLIRRGEGESWPQVDQINVQRFSRYLFKPKFRISALCNVK